MIRVIKERHRSIENVLPYKVPRRLLMDEIKGIVSNINMIPSSADSRCPYERFTGVRADFLWYGDLSFGTYCQVPNLVSDPNYSTNKSRTIGAIALRSLTMGVWKLYSLSTGGIITRRASTCKVIPTPDVVLDKLRDLHFTDELVQNIVDHYDSVAAAAAATPAILPAAIQVQPQVEEIGVSSEDLEANHPADDDRDDIVELREEPSVTPIAVTSYTDSSEDESDSSSDSSTSPDSGESPDRGVETSPPREEYGCRYVAGRRLSGRVRKPTARYQLHVNLKTALAKHGKVGADAVRIELVQMLEKGVWEYVNVGKLNRQQRRSIIRSMIFLKEKYDSTGVFEKLKARLVAGGHMQDETIYSDVSSPTVPVEVVFVFIAIAASEKRRLRSVDITGAYLECDMKDEVYMSLDPNVSAILCDINPTVKTFADNRGSVVVRLLKALYGCKQSGLLWYKKLCAFLIGENFIQNPYERCLFNKTVGGIQISVCFHVDDLLISCKDDKLTDEFVVALNRYFSKVTERSGEVLSYLGMTITTERCGDIVVSIERYVEEYLQVIDTGKIAATPATADLFDESDKERVDVAIREKYHSAVAKLLYLAKRVRPDILTAVSHLSSRVADPSVSDWAKLKRIFRTCEELLDSELVFELVLGSN